jgi:hypothetical protein
MDVNPDTDRELSRLYRSAAREEPPSWLDDRVLAAARAGSVPESKPWKAFNPVRWQLPLALAAVVTLAVSLSLVVEDELEVGSDAPATAPAMPPPIAAQSVEPRRPSSELSEAREPAVPEHARSASSQALPPPSATESPQQTGSLHRSPIQPSVPGLPDRAERAESEPLRQHENAPRGETPAAASPAPPKLAASTGPSPDTAAPPAAPASAAPKPAETAAAAASTESEKTAGSSQAVERATRTPEEQRALAKRERSQADAVARKAPAVAAAAPARADAQGGMAQDQAAAAQKQRELSDVAKPPEQWLREIEQLRREGYNDEARMRLEEFRKRFPSHPLPPSLR